MEIKPTSEIKVRLGINPDGRVQKYLTKRCADYMDKYVPYESGNLRTITDKGNDYVMYMSEYAHYLYIGILYVDPDTGSSWAKKDAIKVPTNTPLKYHTPGTGSYWDKKMMTAEGNKLIKEVQKYINGGS